jgi:hypothetical protein
VIAGVLAGVLRQLARRSASGRLPGLVALLLAVAPVHAGATAPALLCQRDNAPLILGHPLTLTITARNLAQPLPDPGAAGFAPDWLLQNLQTGSSERRGQREQTATLTLYPLRAGRLSLPAIRVGRASCPAQSLRVADRAPGAAPLQWRSVVAPAQPYLLQPVQVELQIVGGGNFSWEPPPARSNELLLTAPAPTTRSTLVDGQRQLVQVFRWQALPLQDGPVTVDFGQLRLYAFGQLRIYAPAPLSFEVRALPLWWPRDGLVGQPQLQLLQASRQLQLGQTGVWRLRLQAAGLDRRQLLQLGNAWRSQLPAALGVTDIDVRRDSAAGQNPVAAAGDAWQLSVYFRPRRAGNLALPALRLDYFDPATVLPAMVRWQPPALGVDDPRPARVVVGLAVAAMLLALFIAWRRLRRCLHARRALQRALDRLASADSADALRLAWLALPIQREAPALTLEAWLQGAAPHDNTLRDIAHWLQQQLYATPAAGDGDAAASHAAALARRLRQHFSPCGRWR